MSRVRETMEQKAGRQLPAGTGVSASKNKSARNEEMGGKKRSKKKRK